MSTRCLTRRQLPQIIKTFNEQRRNPPSEGFLWNESSIVFDTPASWSSWRRRRKLSPLVTVCREEGLTVFGNEHVTPPRACVHNPPPPPFPTQENEQIKKHPCLLGTVGGKSRLKWHFFREGELMWRKDSWCLAHRQIKTADEAEHRRTGGRWKNKRRWCWANSNSSWQLVKRHSERRKSQRGDVESCGNECYDCPQLTPLFVMSLAFTGGLS